ncbi:putative zinc-finger domain-containing protein [Septoria linicola]|nr:putative zinc-finger domain-containing protein [Septoria linicola]
MSNVPFPFGGAQSASHQQSQQQQQDGQAPLLNGASSSAHAPPPVMPMAALPAEVLAALQGIAPEQLGAIFQAFQSGLIPMPPANFATVQPAPAPAPPPIDPRRPANTPASSHAHGALGASAADVDMDQEDGEIDDSEADGANTPQTRGFLRTPPKGPRDGSSRRGSHQFQQQVGQATRPGLTPRASSSTLPKAMLPNGKAPMAAGAHAGVSLRPSKEAASKAFIREMHQAGYTYDDLLREVKDTKMLRRMYEQLSLPIPSSSTTKAANVTSTVPSPVDTTRKPMPAKPAKPQAAPPKDRSEYLAKLQAAKAKKTEAAKASTNALPVAQATQPTVTPSSQPQTVVPGAPLKPTTAAPLVKPQPIVKAPVPMSKEKTDELRRRLEAIKAKRAAEQSAKLSSDTAQPSSPAGTAATGNSTPQQITAQPTAGLGAGQVEAAVRAAKEDLETAAPALPAPGHNTTFARPSSGTASPLLSRGVNLPGLGLPGLFTSFIPPSAPPTSSPRPPVSASSPHVMPPVRSASASGAAPDMAAPSAPLTAPVTPNDAAQQSLLSQHNNVRASERYVIEVSSDDDEDDEDDMDTDDSSEEEAAPSSAPVKEATKPSSGPENGTSTPGTPNAYKRKLEEIEQFKQQIAEKERRRKLANIPSAHPNGHSTTTQHAPSATIHQVISTANGLSPGHSASPAVSSDVAPTVPSAATVAATRLARTQEKEALQRRLRELEALRSKHDSGSPTVPQIAAIDGENRLVDETAQTTTAQPFVAADTNDTIEDMDDEDDEDLYGDGTNNDQRTEPHQEAQNTRVQPLVNSQATTDSSGSQHGVSAAASAGGEQPLSVEDVLYHPMEVNTGFGEQAAEAVDTANLDQGGEDGYVDDDDDLDNVYEPSTTLVQTSNVPRSPVEPTGAHEDSDDAMDTSAESSDSESDSELEPDAASEPAQQVPVQLSASGPRIDEFDDRQADELDLAPELQPAEDQLDKPVQPNGTATRSRYTPYESALRRFKDYRYHPEFTNTVPTGFKSLTYNHKIDPVKTVCPFELENGECGDPNCGYQHFHQMNLHDNDLLRLMGTERTPARNPEEDQRWKEGLQNLVRELRTTNFGRDAGLIAQRIAEYRRSFVNDPTRVVLLDD